MQQVFGNQLLYLALIKKSKEKQFEQGLIVHFVEFLEKDTYWPKM